jgi:spermidine synthase
MGVFAAATLPLYDQTFYLMHWLLNTLEASSVGYILYMLSSNGIALLVMLPTTFCAGMTLPLITCILLREFNGERNIGAVYAANTVGAIVGVFFAVHIGMPQLGLKNLILFGASIDAILGLTLFWFYCRKNGWQKKPVYIMTVFTLLLIAIGSFSKLDHKKMASGIFRKGIAINQDKLNVVYHRDGKTASVSLTQHSESDLLTISTNGKPDASIQMGNKFSDASDEVTQVLLATIPMALNPEAQTVAIIGFGSGVTTNVTLKNPGIKRVDTIEIEPFMVEAAEQFGRRVELAYTDPRSKIFIEDAKSFFAGHNRRYDIIISEPSNPWVSGVANLFTKEFYKSVLPVLENDGIFTQWVQTYEIDMDLIGSIFKALSYNFSDYSVYILTQYNLLIVAKKSGEVGPLSDDILNIPAIAKELQSVYVNSAQDINFRRVGGKKTLQPYFDHLSIPVNSDYFPVLDQNVNRVRFLGENAGPIVDLSQQRFPLARLIEGQLPSDKTTQITLTPRYTPSALGREATQLRDYFLRDHKMQFDPNLNRYLPFEAKAITSMCRGDYSGKESIRFAIIFNVGTRIISYLSKSEILQIWSYWESLGAKKNLMPEEFVCFSLFKAISAQNGAEMRLHATSLLKKENLPAGVTDYLAASAITGAVLTDDALWADTFWKAYKRDRSSNAPLPLYLLVLEAHIENSIQNL